MKGKFYLKPILLSGGLGDDEESGLTGGNTGLGGGGFENASRSLMSQVSVDQFTVQSVFSAEEPAPAVSFEPAIDVAESVNDSEISLEEIIP